MASVIQKYVQAFRTWGWRETLVKMYTNGEVKFGTLMGVDRNGNKYFENLEYPFGQHRWIEYKEIHNMEPTSIPPEWHGWMHHQTDDLPKPLEKTGLPITHGEHTPYKSFIGKTDYKGEDQHNWTAHRQRGYKIGSLLQGPNDPDKYWTQPGHPLNPDTNKGGRFKEQKGMEMWDPEDPEGKKTKKPIRSLDEM